MPATLNTMGSGCPPQLQQHLHHRRCPGVGPPCRHSPKQGRRPTTAAALVRSESRVFVLPADKGGPADEALAGGDNAAATSGLGLDTPAY